MEKAVSRFSVDTPSEDFARLIDEGGGMIDARIYSDQDLYDLEMERVFGVSWLFLAHETQIKKPGDFFSTYMAEDPVIVIRQKDGTIKVLLNQCRHRGMKLTLADSGNAKTFVCVYHGWVYDTAGALRSMPQEAAAYGSIDKGKWGARSVPRVETYRGMIFANWDPAAPSLRDYLGDMAYYLDAALDRSPGGMEVYGEPVKWTVACNWKLAAEQSCSDLYHGMTTHQSFNAALQRNPNDDRPPSVQFREARYGHGSGFLQAGPEARAGLVIGFSGDDKLEGYSMAQQLEQIGQTGARIGAERASNTVHHNLVFPNFALFDGGCNLRIWHPRGPNAVEFWTLGLVQADAEPAVKAQQRLANLRSLGPAGLLEEDDGENWIEIQKILRGHQSRKTVFNAQMGLHRPKGGDPRLPGDTDFGFSEAAARGFYGRWLELVSRGERRIPPQTMAAE